MVSVMHLPFLKADFALAELKIGSVLFLKILLLPNFKTFALLFAIAFCWYDQLYWHLLIKFSNSFTLMQDECDVFSKFFGKLFQKVGLGGLS